MILREKIVRAVEMFVFYRIREVSEKHAMDKS